MTIERTTTDPAHAARVLIAGGIVAVPTETVYGLAALVHDRDAVLRVYAVKARPLDHPLIVHLSATDDPARWGRLSRGARALAAAFWPGPLTLLVPRTDLVPDWVTGGRTTVALRVPRHRATLDLLDRLPDALVAPSANRFGRVSPTTAEHVLADLGDDVDLVLDGGPCTVGVESTIVECIDDHVRILRPGAVTADDIERVLGTAPGSDSGPARAPGMLPSHYAPRARVVLVGTADEGRGTVEDLGHRDVRASLLWDDDVERFAAQLYARMRSADDEGVEVIVAVLPPDEGIGRAVCDRLRKAAADPRH